MENLYGDPLAGMRPWADDVLGFPSSPATTGSDRTPVTDRLWLTTSCRCDTCERGLADVRALALRRDGGSNASPTLKRERLGSWRRPASVHSQLGDECAM